MNSEQNFEEEFSDQRLNDLNAPQTTTNVNHNYSKFVKLMRWALPIFALIMMVVVLAWPELDEQIEAIPKEDILGAIQSQNNQDIIRLEIPEADFKTQNGESVSVQALQGTYDQKGEKLFLQDDVKITHESSYVLDAQELRINIKTQEAFSNKKVKIDKTEEITKEDNL